MLKNVNWCAFADEASAELDEQIRIMLKCKLNYLEARNADGKGMADKSASELKEMRKKLDDAGIAVWSIGSSVGKIDISNNPESHYELLKRFLDAADILGAKHIRFFSFYFDGMEKAAARNRVIELMGGLSEIAAGTGICMCHENEKGIYGDDIAGCVDLLENVSGIKAVFDPANFVQCGVDPMEAWEKLEKYIEYVHIKDSMKDGTIVPAGRGDGKIKEILERYFKAGGKTITLEPHLWEFAGLGNLERAGEKSIIASWGDTQEEAFVLGVNEAHLIVDSL